MSAHATAPASAVRAASSAANVADLTGCKAVLAPIEHELRFRRGDSNSLCLLIWRERGNCPDTAIGPAVVIGHGANMLGAYRQAAERFVRFGGIEGMRRRFG